MLGEQEQSYSIQRSPLATPLSRMKCNLPLHGYPSPSDCREPGVTRTSFITPINMAGYRECEQFVVATATALATVLSATALCVIGVLKVLKEFDNMVIYIRCCVAQ